MKNAIIYTRVSTDEQADRGYSLIDQEARLRKYCELNNIEITAHYQDDHSAKNFNRPEFQKMLEFIRMKKNSIDYLLFVKWDRFSRNAADSYEMIKRLEKLNMEPQAIEQHINFDIPENKLMLAFYLAAPEVENDRRAINVHHGMRRARLEGRYCTTAPMGYSNKRDEFNKPIIVPNDDAKYIIRAYEEMAKGEKGQNALRLELAKEGFRYQRNAFSCMLKNPVYIGKIRISATKNEPEQIVDGLHEGIIDENLFYKVQEIIEGRRLKKKQPKLHKINHDKLPLRGILICSKCGNKLTGSGSKGRSKKYFYYHCNCCGKERIKVEKVHEGIEDVLRKIKINAASKEAFAEVLKDCLAKDENGLKSELKKIGDEIEKSKNRMILLQDKYIENSIDKGEYETIKSRYEKSLNLLIARKAEIQAMTKDFLANLVFCLNFMENVDIHYHDADIDIKKMIIGSIFPDFLRFSKNGCRTDNINQFLKLVCSKSGIVDGKKEGQSALLTGLSSLATREGLEPSTLRSEV